MHPSFKVTISTAVQYALLLLIGTMVSTVVYAATVYTEEGVVCTTIQTMDDYISTTYAPPISSLTAVGDLLITTYCTSKAVRVEIGNGSPDQIIYKYGRYREVGGTYKKITLTGSKMQGAWIVGHAKATLPIVSTRGGYAGNVLAYVCEKSNSVWKCGCKDVECSKTAWVSQGYQYTTMVNTEKTNKTKKKDTKNDTSPVYIGRTETYTFLPGSEMHLVGGGFSTSGAGNSILLNGKKVVTGVRSDDGASMAFTIPNLEPGRYTIEVDTGKAKSKDGALIWITIPGAPVPTVTQITPTTVTQAQDIVITGSGFTPTGNDVVTSFGMVSDLRSPDGIHITIPTYTPFGKVVTFRDERGVRKTAGTDSSGKPVPFRYPMSVHVVNTGGVSNPSTFTLEI